ncbi:hypothetical protein [Halonatronum saccharophilum]|uniref:hypothetical protein n=1 Tax=Halonatronum saccharophilum TaxID=150060 RepID=UPI000485FCB2|nr:hypothetical protein [Halonatronum saccharophilum]
MKIGYIDDKGSDLRIFQRRASEDFDEVVGIELKDNILEIIQEIIECRVDAIVVDYLLNEGNSNIHFNGADVVKKLEEEKIEFPSFILTSFDQDAENELIDVNKIYNKERYYDVENEGYKILNRRIRRQIENYRNLIKQAEEKILKLKNKGELAAKEKEALIELDEFLVKATSTSSKLPKELKTNTVEEKLDNIIEMANYLLEEVKKNND